MTHSVELLAPAGSPEALKAAIANGADAVYLGGTLFSARANAVNFDNTAMLEAIRLTHAAGVRIYVTVNTLLDPDELEAAADYAGFLGEAGADAVIVQDLGLMRLIRQRYPFLPIHASTQMTIYSEWGCRFLEEAGVERVVLAREVSLAEIEHISQRVSLPLEVFVHGALCISYSGQCLMSSLIGGRSGNRGKCAQPCRLPYRLLADDGKPWPSRAPGAHLLSPSDLNALTVLPELIRTDVTALKIEGRMKRPEYVATVVRVYRQALDRCLGDPLAYRALAAELLDLEQIFNRGFTTGYFYGHPGADLMSTMRPSNRGVFLGSIGKPAGSGHHAIRLEQPLHAGDGIEIWHPDGDTSGMEVVELFQHGRQVPAAPPGDTVELLFPAKSKKGEPVYKTSDRALLDRAGESYRSFSLEGTIPLSMRFTAKPGQPADLRVRDDRGHETVVIGNNVVEYARDVALTPDRVRQQLARLGGTYFRLADFEADIPDPVNMPLSEINAMRRQGAEQLTIARCGDPSRPASLPECDVKPHPSPVAAQPVLSVSVADLASLSAAVEGGAERVYFGGESFAGCQAWDLTAVGHGIGLCRKSDVQPVISLPRIVAQRESTALLQRLSDIAALNPGGFLARNPGHVMMLRAIKAGPIMLDYSMNLFNPLAAEACGEPVSMTLSPELSLKQIRKNVRRLDERFGAGKTEVLVHGSLPLMVSEHCLLDSRPRSGAGSGNRCTRPCRDRGFILRDRMGLSFPVRFDDCCRMQLFNSKDLCLFGELPAFHRLGVSIRIEGIAHSPTYIHNVTSVYSRWWKNRMSGLAGGNGLEMLQLESPQGHTRGHCFRGV